MTDELDRIERRLQELSERFGADSTDLEMSEVLNGALDVVRDQLEGHELVLVHEWDSEGCTKCGTVWPCDVVYDVMAKLGLDDPPEPNLPPEPEQNVPPLVSELQALVRAAIVRMDAAKLADGLGKIIADHVPNGHGECPRCGVDWPCPPVALLAGEWGLALSPAMIGADQWIKRTPTMAGATELAERIRHALQSVDDAGYRTWMTDDGDEVGIQRVHGVRLLALVVKDDSGAWTVQTWQDAT